MHKYKSSFFAIILLLLFHVSNHSNAQSNWEAGIRFGDVFSFEATIPIGASPRLHPAVYIYNNVGIATYFDWLFAFDTGPQGLKIYPGVGPEIHFGNDIDFNIAGDFGLEYSFDFPLTIGFDWRPGFSLTNDFNFYAGNWGIFARFRFGEGTRIVKAH